MKLLKTAIVTAITGLLLTTAYAQNPPRPNSFQLQSFQAGSTTEIDNLRVVDLDVGTAVYTNSFSAPSDATNKLNLFYYPQGDDNPTNFFTNNFTMTRVVSGKLRLETTGFGANGSGGYNSHSEAEFATALPRNFLVDFDATRLQWAGHFHFHVFYKAPTDSLSAKSSGGAFSTNRFPALRLDVLRMAASGSAFQQYGLVTNFAFNNYAWPILYSAPAGDLTTTHRLGISLSNNIARFYLDGVLLNSGNISNWVSDDVCTPHKAIATAQLVNGNVAGAILTDYGCGYTNAPLVLIQGGGGSGATATATVVNGMVTGINITSSGCCYTNTPKIVIASPPFVPSVGIRFSRVEVTQHVTLGRNYVLESSTNLVDWAATGPQFNAQSEDIVSEYIINQTGQYFRLRQVP